ncbi:carbamoyl phosphate synthase-like protein [Stieleria neptunia]|uniref:Carbamoyl phosphate synthase-like protein n=1 Tax=Stieleria neptunia TaxID=2527979 RepID=A0A518HPJ5_9BACT|nr:ATP-grasp domain-containing protein [Stieleria neptunia]QDV42751.1 carbamoyl phosphate synthase-like protein [Stieleria neptunia]
MSLAELVDQPEIGNHERRQNLTRRVLLLGNDDRVLLAVARGLGRNGISVDAAWCDPDSPALKSQYVHAFHCLAPYTPHDDQWLDALHALVKDNDYDLVIPCNDYAVVPLQLEREKLDPDTHWYLINDDAFQVAFDKARTSRVATELGINVPRECEITDADIQRGFSDRKFNLVDRRSLRFPVYVKPRSSITACDVTNKRAARRVDSPDELAECLIHEFPDDGVLIQESFSGVGIGVEILAHQGQIVMQIQHQRLRETIDGGSTYRETIAEIPELTEATRKLVHRLNYTGVGMFEFRYNRETGAWVFLEINARFWGSLPLAIAAKANFPFALYELLVKGQTNFHTNHTIGVRCRNLINDLRAFRHQQATEFELENLLFGRDYLDFYAPDDWRPQLATLVNFARSVLGKFTRRVEASV